MTLVAVAAWLCIFAGAASAQTVIERLVMPGPLSDAHAELESNCGQCHLAFEKSAQDNLCRDCHDEVDADLSAGTGFHGLEPDVAETTCKSCHTDHEGRDHDIAPLDEDAFDHDRTDYPLRGKHTDVACTDCHADGAPRQDAALDCFSCHREDDPHHEALGENCADCHVVQDWEEIRFDHDATDFSLLDTHATTDCMECHVDQVFEGTPTACIDCHRDDDAHEGRYGERCDTCHGADDWEIATFDHAAETEFALEGGHTDISCDDCHTQSLYDHTLSQECVSCHLDDDDHDGRNGSDCADCHSVIDWTETHFDHQQTRFPLSGAHSSTSCAACHVAPVDERLPGLTCISCHADDDAHDGFYGPDCEACHGTDQWETALFNHDRDTDFALNGAHRTADCKGCHVIAIHVASPSRACAGCHGDDDPHDGQLGGACGSCHTESDWGERVSFDHDISRFPLLGAHRDVECDDCHDSEAFRDAPIECVGCHERDDPHRRRFGQDCERCHSPVNWNRWIFDHDVETDFALTDGHAGVDCYDCHTRRRRNPTRMPNSCATCHTNDDPHDGRFGRTCDRCHVATSWANVFPRR